MRLIVEIFDIDIKIGISMSFFWRLFFEDWMDFSEKSNF